MLGSKLKFDVEVLIAFGSKLSRKLKVLEVVVFVEASFSLLLKANKWDPKVGRQRPLLPFDFDKRDPPSSGFKPVEAVWGKNYDPPIEPVILA